MLKGFQYRFYPTKEQEISLSRSFGSSRFVYNWALDLKSKSWSESKTSITYNQLSSKLTDLKKQQETSWLKDISSVVLQQSLRHLDSAYSRFFKNKKGYPNFKKRNGHQSISYPSTGFTYQDGMIKIAKLGELDIVWSRRFEGTPSSLTISKNPSNQYFVSILVDEPIQELPRNTNAIGIDFGLKTFAITSDREEIDSPKPLKKLENKLKIRQRKVSRKKKGSKNRTKAKLKLARVHQKISDIRNDFLHKTTTRIIRENQAILVESLNIKGMMKNHKLAKAISDVSWSECIRQLEYKSKWYGRLFQKIGRWFPSSKACNICGMINENLELKDRTWSCYCGMKHDRDYNASINIKNEGLRILKTIGTMGLACEVKDEVMSSATGISSLKGRGEFKHQLQASTILTKLASAGYLYYGTSEVILQNALAGVFTKEGLDFKREYSLSKKDRIDFLIGKIGIEVKIQGTEIEVLRQLLRYLESDEVESVILVSTKRTHASIASGLPTKKPIYFYHIPCLM